MGLLRGNIGLFCGNVGLFHRYRGLVRIRQNDRREGRVRTGGGRGQYDTKRHICRQGSCLQHVTPQHTLQITFFANHIFLVNHIFCTSHFFASHIFCKSHFFELEVVLPGSTAVLPATERYICWQRTNLITHAQNERRIVTCIIVIFRCIYVYICIHMYPYIRIHIQHTPPRNGTRWWLKYMYSYV